MNRDGVGADVADPSRSAATRESTDPSTGAPDGGARLAPIEPKGPPVEPSTVEWGKIARDSGFFLAIMHSFRWTQEAGTRAGGIGLGDPYVRSVENLHGWADGDPFYVNYIGHPMQGAVSGRLYLVNDARYNRTEFGKSREYWKGKLRAAAFAWAFSEQFEIGPLSEASIGHIQKDFPQQGFVDHVVTPTVGLGWMVAEDALDRYVIRPLEDRTACTWVRLALRTGLNPARSFANLIDRRAPWDRGSRAGIQKYMPDPGHASPTFASATPPPLQEPKPAPFEFSMLSGWRQFAGSPCMGGGGEAAYRVAPEIQLALAVNGCKRLGLPTDFSGDALVYQIGSRWTPAPNAKWSPHAHVLVGGMKVTYEQLDPEEKATVLAANKDLDPLQAYTLHDQYTRHTEASGLAVSVGTGVDYRLNVGLALRVASIEYTKSTIGRIAGASSTGFQFSTGLVLLLGTW